MRIIAFEGAHGSAKSTRSRATVQILRDLGYKVGLIHELARNYKPGQLHDPEDPIAVQGEMLDAQIKAEKQVDASQFDVLVLDRTVLSPIAYAFHWYTSGVYGPRGRCEAWSKINRLAGIACRHLEETRPTVYLCKPRPLYDDGFRDTRPEFQTGVWFAFPIAIAMTGAELTAEVKLLE